MTLFPTEAPPPVRGGRAGTAGLLVELFVLIIGIMAEIGLMLYFYTATWPEPLIGRATTLH